MKIEFDNKHMVITVEADKHHNVRAAIIVSVEYMKTVLGADEIIEIPKDVKKQLYDFIPNKDTYCDIAIGVVDKIEYIYDDPAPDYEIILP